MITLYLFCIYFTTILLNLIPGKLRGFTWGSWESFMTNIRIKLCSRAFRALALRKSWNFSLVIALSKTRRLPLLLLVNWLTYELFIWFTFWVLLFWCINCLALVLQPLCPAVGAYIYYSRSVKALFKDKSRKSNEASNTAYSRRRVLSNHLDNRASPTMEYGPSGISENCRKIGIARFRW